ncbi:Jmj4 protein [Schizosaccharomyces cryophilus OY26]|uniref:Jmj4 protein n=1 Tax=Schizosaccharomyces cryophilus (strain OY26 / ATCC MYA-4695 / CBS 11777 / NBRC 106824 / NRRL Y48691) TaxID=653667 RepID=S9W260_SCHCR|nr:Jmj4 protein [Schizosaccharomyces cryophilus OY26]EPY52120.1 Jmj4 protein [Schizosaccharomyces cryophilus OY26]
MSSSVSSYSGFSPKEDDKIPVLDNVDHISPEEFYKDYVSKRVPVVIKSSLPESDWKGYLWKQEDYLLEKIGQSVCKIEPMDPSTGTFGQGMSRNEMTVAEFLQRIKAGERLYLTTQYDDSDDVLDGDDEVSLLVKSLCPAPTDKLLSDFSLTPALMGNLVPQQCNIWIGRSENGTSSGLHHDFHDNIYTVVKGHKRFVILSPDSALHLQLAGKISKIHQNGLISYEGEDRPQRSDGLTELDAAIAHTQFLEMKISDLKELQASEDIIQRLEAEYEAEMDNVLQMQLGGEAQDWDELQEGDADSLLDKSSNENDEGFSSADGGDQLDSEEQVSESGNEKPSLPDHFTKITVPGLHKYMGFDNAKDIIPSEEERTALSKTHPLVVDLEPGDMFYLPASWFHEVTSSSAEGESSIHVAFNYWFHPPDNLHNFDHPYEDRDLWKAKRSMVSKAIQRLYATSGTTEKRNWEGESSTSEKQTKKRVQ